MAGPYFQVTAKTNAETVWKNVVLQAVFGYTIAYFTMKTNIVLFTPSLNPASGFITTLSDHEDVRVTTVATTEEMLRLVREESPALVVLEEGDDARKALGLVIDILSINAMVNTITITAMDPESWHEKSEGLGMLEPLPAPPSATDARKLLATLGRLGVFT